jgi:hypothetical protein
MRRFLLWRREDKTGVSGTGIVAEGCIFGDGTTVVRWRGPTRTTTVHDGIESVARVHLHGGATRVLWCDTSLDGPRHVHAMLGGGVDVPRVDVPIVRLHSGAFEPNGIIDKNGATLKHGIKVRTPGSELGDIGEIYDFLIYPSGEIHVGVSGVNCCNQAGFRLDEVTAYDLRAPTPEAAP